MVERESLPLEALAPEFEIDVVVAQLFERKLFVGQHAKVGRALLCLLLLFDGLRFLVRVAGWQTDKAAQVAVVESP